jgi:hypothetical protein
MGKTIEKEIKNLILTKKKASNYIYNDRYIDFCEEIDEKILKLRKRLMNELFKNPDQQLNKFQVSCFKRIDGYLIEEFIRDGNYTINKFNEILSEIRTGYIDNYITLWHAVKPISLNDWLDQFKKLSTSKQYKWEPNFKRSLIYNKTLLVKLKLNKSLVYWYIDKEYNFSHLFIVEEKNVKILNKEEYLKLDIFGKILIKIFHKSTEFISVG